MKVLIADIETETQDRVQVGLESFRGVEVETAKGTVALDRIRMGQFDCVFAGVGTGPDGDEEFARLLEGESEALVVAVGGEPAIQKVKDSDARRQVFAFLQSPVEPVELYRTVSRVMQRSSDQAVSSS